MGDIVDKRVLTDALKTLAGYLNDLGRSSFDSSTTKLRLVINYAQHDETARALAGLFRAQISRERFLEQVMGADGLAAPEQPFQRLAFGYDLLLHIKMGWKLNLREVLSRNELAGGSMDDRWARFVQRFVTPLEEGALAIRAEIERASPERIDPDEAVRAAVAILYPNVVTSSSSASVGAAPAAAAPALAPAPTAPVAPRLEPLAAALAASGIDAATRSDLKVDLELLGIELQKQQPSPVRLAELVEGFASAGLEAPATSCIGELLLVASGDGEAVRASLAAERAVLNGERAALTAERAALTAERGALTAERESLTAERRALDLAASQG